jgi:hypothetical protein
MWFRKKDLVSAVDLVWSTKAEKLRGILEAVRQAAASGRCVLLLAHFRMTRSEISGALSSNGIQHQVFDHPLDPCSFLSGQTGSRAHQVILSLSERISPYSKGTAPDGREQALDVIVAERYPLQDRDDLILSFASACRINGPVHFHSSFEDSMFRRFGSDRYTKVFRALGNASTGPLTGTSITRAIRSAQKKVKKQSLGDQRVPSPDDWFTYNMRR